MFGVVTRDSDVMPPFIFLHGIRLNFGSLHQVPGGGMASLDRRYGCLAPQIATSLIIICVAQLSQKPAKLSATPKQKAKITTAFTNLNKETVRDCS